MCGRVREGREAMRVEVGGWVDGRADDGSSQRRSRR